MAITTRLDRLRARHHRTTASTLDTNLSSCTHPPPFCRQFATAVAAASLTSLDAWENGWLGWVSLPATTTGGLWCEMSTTKRERAQDCKSADVDTRQASHHARLQPDLLYTLPSKRSARRTLPVERVLYIHIPTISCCHWLRPHRREVARNVGMEKEQHGHRNSGDCIHSPFRQAWKHGGEKASSHAATLLSPGSSAQSCHARVG